MARSERERKGSRRCLAESVGRFARIQHETSTARTYLSMQEIDLCLCLLLAESGQLVVGRVVGASDRSRPEADAGCSDVDRGLHRESERASCRGPLAGAHAVSPRVAPRVPGRASESRPTRQSGMHAKRPFEREAR